VKKNGRRPSRNSSHKGGRLPKGKKAGSDEKQHGRGVCTSIKKGASPSVSLNNPHLGGIYLAGKRENKKIKPKGKGEEVFRNCPSESPKTLRVGAGRKNTDDRLIRSTGFRRQGKAESGKGSESTASRVGDQSRPYGAVKPTQLGRPRSVCKIDEV